MRVWIAADLKAAPRAVGRAAARAERIGADCFAVADNAHDAMLTAMAAIHATSRIEVATMALVAFARSPMVTAVGGWDLQEASGGRFRLGLGPLVPQMLIGKYSTPWLPPAPRMREYIAALRAIWACWRDRTPLDFRGEHYRFTRQAPYNMPDPILQPDPLIHLGVIGEHMTALAGEAADGIMTHVTNTSALFVRDWLWPNLRRGAARSDRAAEAIEVIVNPPLALGADAAAIVRRRAEWKDLLAILLSTPNYWPTLELMGVPGLGPALRDAIRANRWQDLSGMLGDELADELIGMASYDELPGLLADRYKGIASAVCLPLPDDERDDEAFGRAIRKIREI